jgi:hypothetical protein
MGCTFDIRRRQDDTTGHKLENIFFERGIVNHMTVHAVLRRCGGWVCVDRHLTVVGEKTSSRDACDVDTWTNDVWRISCEPGNLRWSALVATSHNLHPSAELTHLTGRRHGSYLPLGRPMFVLG